MKRGGTHFRLAESAWGVGFRYICILLARLELQLRESTV